PAPSYPAHREPLSFPTRRSSDLRAHGQRGSRSVGGDTVAQDRARATRPSAGMSFDVVQIDEVLATTRAVRRRLDLERPVDNQLLDRKSTRLNSSHRTISYAVFCL